MKIFLSVLCVMPMLVGSAAAQYPYPQRDRDRDRYNEHLIHLHSLAHLHKPQQTPNPAAASSWNRSANMAESWFSRFAKAAGLTGLAAAGAAAAGSRKG